jgi:hypothetical protein
MVSLLIGLARFWFAIRKAWRDPSFRLLAALTGSLLLVGTLVFHQVEGWSYLDSFYFSAITLVTVGYGDFTPQTTAGKLLAIVYIFSGFGLLVALLTRFAEALINSERMAACGGSCAGCSTARRKLPATRVRPNPAPPRHPRIRKSACPEPPPGRRGTLSW